MEAKEESDFGVRPALPAGPDAPSSSGAGPHSDSSSGARSPSDSSSGAGSPSDSGAELIARAQLICGEQHVLTDPVVVETYRRYGVSYRAPAPLVVLLPASASEVAGLVGACAALSVGWTVRGAATGADGPPLAQAGHALIVLTRMRRILKALNADGEITVEPGVPVAMLRRAAGASLLPGASPSATVGGHVASVRGLRGVVGIELVEPDGSLAHAAPRQPGYDLAGAFCGSRGAAGIAVSLTLIELEP